jgi:hypothetical protein
MSHSKVTVHSMAMDEGMVIDGGTMFDPLQSLGDATRTVTSAENTMRRAHTGITRFRVVLGLGALGVVVGIAMMVLAGLIADVIGMTNTASALYGAGIPVTVASLIFMAFWTVASYDRKVFENRDVAEEKLDQAQEQYAKVVAMVPASELLALTTTQREVQAMLSSGTITTDG